MKGKLIHDQDGWWVQHSATSPDGKEYFQVDTMLHPDDVKFLEDCRLVFDNIEARVAVNPDVEFRTVTEIVAPVGDLDTDDYYTITYAKLINHSVDTNEMVSDTYTGEYPFPPKDGYDTVNDVEKLAKERTDAFVKTYNTHLEIRQYAFAKGFIEGYNKAKEETESIFANILDHLCDKMESISQEQIDKDNFQLARYRTFKYIFEYIQSLNKQPIETKETLYTEEQVKEIVEKSRETGLTAEYLMLSLKQPKKD